MILKVRLQTTWFNEGYGQLIAQNLVVDAKCNITISILCCNAVELVKTFTI